MDTPTGAATMPTAALYARISQDELGLERGVQRQLADARQLAEARGWEIVAEFTDNDVSAYNGAHRKGYSDLIARAEAGDFEHIVVYQTSRLCRSRPERADVIDRLGRLRVSVAAVRGPELDLASSSGRMVADVLGAFDTMESEVKGERVARAALQRAQEGRANGPVAYGWRREYQTDGSGRVVDFRDVEDPEQAAVVREIVDRILGGDTLRGIADDLEARGIPTPSGRPGVRWRHSTVRKLALRPANVAQRIHQGRVIGDAAWPPIIDPDRHARVVAHLTAPRGDRPRLAPANRKHLLTYGEAFACGVCGGPLRVARKRSAGKVYELYVCDEAGCVGRSRDKVDDLIGAVVVERLSRPDAIDLLAGDDEAAREAHERAEALRARLNVAADQYADGAIDGEQLRRITARLRPELEAAEEEARRSRPVAVPAELEELTRDDAEAVWSGLDVRRRRAILDVLGLRVRILPTRQGPGFVEEDVEVRWPA
jgi:site-specific DNA recombinase